MLHKQLAEELSQVRGHVLIEVIRDSGDGPKVIQRRDVNNLVVNVGKRQILRLAAGLQPNIFDQFRIGTSPAAPNSGQTNVLSPVTCSIVTVGSITLLAATRTLQWVESYPSGVGSKSANGISEIVLLNQHTSPGGSAAMRSTYTPVNKTTNDKLKFTYSLRAV